MNTPPTPPAACPPPTGGPGSQLELNPSERLGAYFHARQEYPGPYLTALLAGAYPYDANLRGGELQPPTRDDQAAARGMSFTHELAGANVRREKIQTRRPLSPAQQEQIFTWLASVQVQFAEQGQPMPPVRAHYLPQNGRWYLVAGEHEYKPTGAGGAREVAPYLEVGPCRFGRAGGWLYQREAYNPNRTPTAYRGDGEGALAGPWSPARFMPKDQARALLYVYEVRLERLSAITEGDAHLEGFASRGAYLVAWDDLYGTPQPVAKEERAAPTHYAAMPAHLVQGAGFGPNWNGPKGLVLPLVQYPDPWLFTLSYGTFPVPA